MPHPFRVLSLPAPFSTDPLLHLALGLLQLLAVFRITEDTVNLRTAVLAGKDTRLQGIKPSLQPEPPLRHRLSLQ